MNGTQLSLLLASRGQFGLMKFRVVLRLGLDVSDVVIAYSALTDHLSPLHSPPSAMI